MANANLIETTNHQRKKIAWCGSCGNISTDGMNFDETKFVVGKMEMKCPRGTAQCLGCGALGLIYIQELALIKAQKKIQDAKS